MNPARTFYGRGPGERYYRGIRADQARAQRAYVAGERARERASARAARAARAARSPIDGDYRAFAVNIGPAATPLAARADAHQRARILRSAAEGRAMRHEYLNPKSGPGRARGWIVAQYDALSAAAARQEAIGNGTAPQPPRATLRERFTLIGGMSVRSL